VTTPTERRTRLAFDVEGSGAPVVFLHGLTFDRRTWRPILDRLDGAVRAVTIDLPAHGESAGPPKPLEPVAEQIHEVVTSLGIERPVVVGHSFGAALACLYTSTHPSLGLVTVDDGPEVQPFAEFLQRLAPALRGPHFAHAWETIEASLGLERIPEPVRSVVLESHEVNQSVVLGYWEQALSTDPAALQQHIDQQLPRIGAPWLAVFGRPVTAGERERLDRLADVRIEEWDDAGHFVHLVDPDRFTAHLRRFINHCTSAPLQG
jgi:pimeloyl-ACP methyl ester carboxylesterase